MEVILSILLHLAVIFSPGEYTIAEIDSCETANQTDVNAIRADEALTAQLVEQYKEEVKFIVILDYEPEY